MIAAGLVAKKAVERGLTTQPWVKASLAPGSKVVTDYLDDAGLTPYLDKLRFNLVGYGCTTCIGNSGPLSPGDLQGDPRRRPRHRGGPQRQPELRGADQLRRPGQLPGLAPAGRRLRPRRDDGHRPDQRPDRPRPAGQGRLPQGHLADPGRGRRRRPQVGPGRDVPQGIRRGLQGRRALELAPGPRGRPLRVGRQLDLRQEPALLHRDARPSPPPVEEIRGPGPWPSWATASRPTTSRRPGRSRSRGRRAAT